MEQLITAFISVAVAIGGLAMMFKFLNGRINTIKKEVDKDLERGDARFDKILDVLEVHGVDLAEIKKDIEYMRKNGK